jgi:lycopene cyclase domain-containing protein
MKSLYLLVNFFTIIVPFVFSFHPKIKFHLTWKAFFPAAILVGVLFVIWDELFTAMGVWGFNPDYVAGVYIFNLPLEELLFFICIPFSCVFTYFCLDRFFDLSWNPKIEAGFCLAFSLALMLVGIVYHDRIYTLVTFISTGLVCLTLKFILKVDWFGKAAFVYGILLMPFLIVNGVLTGTGIDAPVVWYDHSENLDIRILTIPIEDAFYGFELILVNLYLYKLFLGTGKPENVASSNTKTISSK